jgi:hypothetical protein
VFPLDICVSVTQVADSVLIITATSSLHRWLHEGLHRNAIAAQPGVSSCYHANTNICFKLNDMPYIFVHISSLVINK